MKTNKKQTKKENNRTEKITIAVLALLLIGGGCYIGGKHIMDSKQPVIETVPGDDEVAIKNQGITIKKLNTVTNKDGSVTKTFSYTIEPANATNKGVTLTAKYADGTDCSAIVTLSSNETDQTISITCKSDFDKVINVSVVSKANTNAKSTITLNYVKKLKSFNAKPHVEDYGGYSIYFSDRFAGDSSIIGEFSYQYNNMTTSLNTLINDLFDITYTKFTKDQKFNYFLKDVTVINDEIYTNTVDWGSYGDLINNYYSNLLTEYLNDQTNDDFSTVAEDIWNLSNDNQYHSLLLEESKYNASESYIAFSFGAEVYFNNGDNTESILNTRFEGLVTFPLSFDYSSKTVGVDTLTPEITNIDF